MFKFKICKSNAGYYVGITQNNMPYDRLSCYFPNVEKAQHSIRERLVLVSVSNNKYEIMIDHEATTPKLITFVCKGKSIPILTLTIPNTTELPF